MKSRHKQGFIWQRQPDNHLRYNFTYFAYKHQQLLQVLVEKGSLVKSGTPLISVIQEGQKQDKPAPFSGVVVELLTVGGNPADCQKLKLLIMEQCEHQPITPDKMTCAKCGEQVWRYEDPTEISFCRRDFYGVEDYNQQLTWKVTFNQEFKAEEVLGSIGDSPLFLNFNGRVKFTGEGFRDQTVLKVRKTICKHQKVIEGICYFCCATVAVEKSAPLAVNTNGSVVSGRILQKAEQQIVTKLKSDRKMILILDLDNTIVHCLEANLSCQLPKIDDCLIMKGRDTVLYVKMRHFLKQFLVEILPRYQIYIYTKGTRQYAEAITNYIRNQYVDLFSNGKYEEAFTAKRIISRDQDGDLQKKSLSMIITKQQNFVVIMDDRRDVWGRPDNAIQVKYFNYFSRLPSGVLLMERTPDYYLNFATKFMKDIHSHFYSKLDKGEEADSRQIVRSMKQQLLAGYKAILLFDGEKKAYRQHLTKSFGIQEVQKENEANILIYSSKQLLNKKSKVLSNTYEIPVVHRLWLDYCYQYNYRFSPSLFQYKQGEDLYEQSPSERELFEEALFASSLKDE